MRTLFYFIKKRLAIRRLAWTAAQEKGEQLLKGGKAAESIPYFRQALRSNPGEPSTATDLDRAREGLAEALSKTGQHNKAAALLEEMTPAQYWWSAIRAGLLVTVFIIGGFAAISYGLLFLMGKVGRKIPPISLALSRGAATSIDVRFLAGVDISAGGTTLEPSARTKGAPWRVVRAWEGFENRDAGIRDLGGGPLRCYETVPEGGDRGLFYAIGAPDIVGGYGGGRVYLSAGSAIPAGTYRIWLSGAYLEHTRKVQRHINDPILMNTGGVTETVPWDGAAGRVPVLEVLVQ